MKKGRKEMKKGNGEKIRKKVGTKDFNGFTIALATGAYQIRVKVTGITRVVGQDLRRTFGRWETYKPWIANGNT